MQKRPIVAAFLTAIAATAVSVPGTASAAAYPDHPVKIVVPYAPGGAVDVVARKIAQKLTEQMHQSFIVENKPGATGTIGTRQVAQSDPDGYTLLAMDNTYSVLPYVFKKLPWDHDKAFAPITVSVFVPVLLAVNAQSPYKDLASLIADARQHPDKLTYGSGGVGSAPHFATVAFAQDAKISLTHVPYKGAGEAVSGLIGQQVDMVMVSTASISSQIRGGTVRALAVSGDTRVASLPNVPTFAEAGVPGFKVMNWSGLAAPAGTPPEIVDKLYQEVKKALASKDMQDFLASMSAKPGGITPAEFSRLIDEETKHWAAVAPAAKINSR